MMLQQSKDVIIKNFVTLMKSCDVDVLKDVLINKGIFTANEVAEIFSSPDARHNKRLFFFNIQKKDQRAFEKLIEALRETNQHNLADILAPRISGCKLFQRPLAEEFCETKGLQEGLSAYINSSTASLDVKVVISREFYDTPGHNKAVHFYSTRSKKRGKVLIINNYEYNGNSEYYREGAIVDNRNLHRLFNQLGGWVIHHHDNKTAQELLNIVKQFSQDSSGKDYDICFVIIMGHGSEMSNETVIIGTDMTCVFASNIQNEFNNEKCSVYRGKPKVFLYQVCRGDFMDYTIRPAVTDSIFREQANANSVPTVLSHIMTTNIRTQEDILIGYATLNRYKAHRDTSRGSWYIELICEKFMNHAHDHSVDDLLKLVDQGLRRRMSDKETMQTAEHSSIGFKKLYLNPGIYFENDELKYFND